MADPLRAEKAYLDNQRHERATACLELARTLDALVSSAPPVVNHERMLAGAIWLWLQPILGQVADAAARDAVAPRVYALEAAARELRKLADQAEALARRDG